MSSTGHAASSTSSSGSNVRLILDHALADYTKITGIDLSKTHTATAIQQSSSPEAILELLQEREKAFKESREGNRKLINCLSPIVRVFQALSGIIGEAVNQVPLPPAVALFASIDTLLAVASELTSSYDALLELFECLGIFLKRLEIYTMIPPTPILTEMVVKIVVELLSVLALASKQIKQRRFKKFTKKLLGESEIETVLQRLYRLTQDEARITVAQTLGVIHGLVESVKAVMEDGKASTDGIRQDLVVLHQVLNEVNKTKREQLQWEVQRWLSPPDPSTNQNFVRRARLKGTAAWFLESSVLVEWKSRGSLLWIHGKPGAGKSTLLSAFIQEIERMHAAGLAMMAYYYFDFRDVKKQDCYGLLSSLVSQLSADSDACYNILSKLYSDHIRGTREPDINALKESMTDMLDLPGQGPIYIIVDALDECPNFSSAREEVLEFVRELASWEFPNLHLCVASRPEMDIRMVLERLTPLQISIHDEIGQKEDIVEYINFVVRSDQNMRRWTEEDKQLVVDTLSDKADGMFRWMVCQVDRLHHCFPASIRSVLADLPRSLDTTYEKALLGIREEKRKNAVQLYQCQMASIRPLRVEELAEILAIRFDEAVSPMFNAAWRPENAEEAVMSACSSLIAIVDRGGHRVVQFSHLSAKQYLTSERLSTAGERLSYYHILPEPAHTILAQASLSVLLQLDHKIDRNAIDNFPLAPYAARHWVDHAQFGDVSSYVQELMQRLFDPAMPHFAAWVWLYDIDRDWIEPMSETHPMRPEAVSLYYASLCGFHGLVEHLLVAHPQDVNARGGHHVTSLHAASHMGHAKVVQLLLLHGADVNARDGQHRTPLHIAAGREELVRLLLLHGAGVNARDGQHRTPLHIAADRGELVVSRLLVHCGAKADVRDKMDWTPLHFASEHGNPNILLFLINHNANPNARNKDQETPLFLASRKGNLEAARLLSEYSTNINSQNSLGRTPLYVATENGHYDVVHLLLDRGADLHARRALLHLAAGRGELVLSRLLIERGAELDSRDEMDRTPLHIASERGNPDIVLFLINRGANPNARNKDQETPLFLASRKGNLEAALLLTEHSTDINSQDSFGRTPLYVAAENGHYDIVHMLLNQGADPNAPENKKPPTPPETKLRTPLHLAADQGMFKVAELLLEYGTEVDARDEMDRTPLHFAAQQGHLELVRLLLEYHADVLAVNRDDHTFLDVAWASGHKEIVNVNARYEGGQTALHIAAQHGDTELMSWLIHRKLDPIHPNVEDEDQETPLFPASRNGKLDATLLLLDEKAEVNHRDWQKMTPLHGASENGHDAVAQLLLERNAEVSAKHKNAWTPLHLASRAGQGNVAKVLLDKDAMVNAKNDSNWTPLHMASQEGHLDVVRLLLAHGADVNVQNETDETALHLAAFYAHLDVAQVLLDRGADLQLKNKKCEMPRTLKSKGGKTLLELALERGNNNMARILKLAALGEIPVGEPVGGHQVGSQLWGQQAKGRVEIPE